jgi:flavin-dependent dehydrogenase
MNQAFDVAIIGGGPAGSSAGTLLAKAGRREVIFEKEKFPRFRVGESMHILVALQRRTSKIAPRLTLTPNA